MIRAHPSRSPRRPFCRATHALTYFLLSPLFANSSVLPPSGSPAHFSHTALFRHPAFPGPITRPLSSRLRSAVPRFFRRRDCAILRPYPLRVRPPMRSLPPLFSHAPARCGLFSRSFDATVTPQPAQRPGRLRATFKCNIQWRAPRVISSHV